MLILKSGLLLILSSSLALSLPVPDNNFRLVKRPAGSPTCGPRHFSLAKRPTIRNGDIGVVSAAVAAGPVTRCTKFTRRSDAESPVEAGPEWRPEWKREAEAKPQNDVSFPLVKRPIGNPTSAFPSSKPQPHKRESEPEPQSDAPKGSWKPATAVVGTDGPKGTWKRFSAPRTDAPNVSWKSAAVVKAAGLPNQGWKRSPEEEV